MTGPEQGLREIALETRMEVVIIRPPLVYGPGVKANFEAMMRWLQRPAACLCRWASFITSAGLVALDNLVDLIVTCITCLAAANQTFLVSDGEDVSTTELLRCMGQAMGRPARLIPVPASWLKLAAAWSGPAVRGLLDAFAGADAAPLAALWSHWKRAREAFAAAGAQQAGLERERERLAWQIGEIDKLAPGTDEWAELEAEHTKLANAQSLIDAARSALDAVAEADDNADTLTGRALHALQDVAAFDAQLASTIEVLQGAQAQLQDAAHTLSGYLHHTDLEPQRLQALDERLSAWMGLARRYRRPPAELPALLAQWKDELHALDAAADLEALQRELARALAAFDAEARRISAARCAAAPKLARAVTQAMQQLGMAGGCFEVALVKQEGPQSFGLESAEFLVAGHAGSTPRPLAKVASGGELSRIALAIAVTTSQLEGAEGAAGTLIFDEIDAGVGGAVAETVGRLMKQLGRDRQVLAVTHLPQVAACADHHFVVSKQLRDGLTLSEVMAVGGEVRVAEVARMLGGERLSNTSLAHAQAMLAGGADAGPAARGRKRS